MVTGTTGVVHYEAFKDAIELTFRDGWIYHYSTRKIASHHIKEMKRLAMNGKGLTTYVNQHEEVKHDYDRKYRR